MTATDIRPLRDHPLDFVRESCARVAARASRVRIDAARLEAYARGLPSDEIAQAQAGTPWESLGRSREQRCQLVLMLDAVNFGSGYFPHLRKLAGQSGYRTIESRLFSWFARCGDGPAAPELAEIDADRCREIFGQQEAPADPIEELMQMFARAWRDLGALVSERFEGRFAALVESAGSCGENLIRTLIEMPLYRDVASHAGEPVAFLKRAQITVADLHTALEIPFADLRTLTLFADNLVPHVLRLDGVLVFEEELVERIEAETPIPFGSPEEVEIRACAVHAVEQIAGALRERGGPIWPYQLDAWLWARGGSRRYKLRPRHRSRCAFY